MALYLVLELGLFIVWASKGPEKNKKQEGKKMIRPGVQRSTVAGPQKNKNSEKKKEDTNLDCV